MFALDARTVIFTNFLYLTTVSIFIVFMFLRIKEKNRGVVYWTVSFFLLDLNFLLLSLRNILPERFIIIVPHVFTLVAFLLIKKGFSLFYRVRNRLFTDFLILAAFTLVLILNEDDARLRMIAIAIAGMLVFLDTILLFAFHKECEQSQRRLVVWLFSLSLLVMVFRLVLSLSWSPGVDPLSTGNSLSLISMLLFVNVVIFFFSFVFVIWDRQSRDKDALLEQIRSLSLTDELTGLMNRRGFQEITRYETNRFSRTGKGYSLVIGDIDFFKRVNDTYGHASGDRVLQRMGILLKKECRKIDTVARWGGEEFILLLPETEGKDATVLLERVRASIEAEVFSGLQNEPIRLTMSFGACFCNAVEVDTQRVLEVADRNLYQAKNNGRNQFCLSSLEV